MSSPGYARFKLNYELSPIVLTGGLAANVPGGMIPIISLTEAGNFTGLPSDGDGPNLDNFFANYVPLAGSKLLSQDAATYPFANQAVAANAVIQKPLTVSFRMICPAKGPGGYARKLSTMTALKSSLDQHNNSGGTYTLVSPSFYYVNCVMLDLTDVSGGDTNQAQSAYQWDFLKPLLTLDDAAAAQNSLMSKLSSGTQIDGDPAWSGLQQTVGDPGSLAGASLVPPGGSLGGTGVSGQGA